jgi:hypothetical protein
MIKRFLIFALFFSLVTFAQKSEYVKILGAEDLTVYLDKSSIESKDDDIFVWVMQTHIPPLNIESVKEKIFKSRTLYVFNKKLKRYGILKIVYYNAKGDIIKEFDYSVNTDIETYKYSYPIFKNGLERKILDTIYYYRPELKPKPITEKK